MAFAASEVALRIHDASQGRDAQFFLPPDFNNTLYEPHPYLGVVHRPGYAREVGKYHVHINSLGLRGPEVTLEKPPNTYRILCVGGSTTFGTGATADDKTYPAQLERLLERARTEGFVEHELEFEVLNAGVSGFNSADTLINFELRLLEFDPDAVLIYHAANDGRIVQTRNFKPDYSHMRRPPPIVRISALERFLLGNVRTYAHLVRGTDPEAQLGAMADWVFVDGFKQLTVRSPTWINEPGLQVFMGNLYDLIALARAHDVQPVLSTFAVADTNYGPGSHLAPFVKRANEELHALAERTRTPIVPAAEALDDRAELYDDWMHFNDEGELRHAQVVLQTARAQGLFGLRATRR